MAAPGAREPADACRPKAITLVKHHRPGHIAERGKHDVYVKPGQLRYRQKDRCSWRIARPLVEARRKRNLARRVEAPISDPDATPVVQLDQLSRSGERDQFVDLGRRVIPWTPHEPHTIVI